MEFRKGISVHERYREMVRHANIYRTPNEIEYIDYDALSDRQLAKLRKIEEKLERKRQKKQEMLEKYVVYAYEGVEPKIPFAEKAVILVVSFGMKKAKQIAWKLIKFGGRYAYRATLKPYVDELKNIKAGPITYFTNPINWIKLGLISSIDAIPGGRVILFIIKTRDAFKKSKKIFSKGQQVFKAEHKVGNVISFIKRPRIGAAKKFSPIENAGFGA
jgi:hypothetical protein